MTKTISDPETERLRAELGDTLDQLVDQLNFSRRIDEKVAEIQYKTNELRTKKPLVFAAGVAGAAAATGLVVWGVVRYITKCGCKER